MADTRPLQVGDVLHGFCGGIFGRDHYHCSVVESLGPDWVVAREPDPDIGTGIAFASGRDDLMALRQYRTPTTKPADGSPCCDMAAEQDESTVLVPRVALDLLVELAAYSRAGGQTTPVGQRAIDALDAAGLLPTEAA